MSTTNHTSVVCHVNHDAEKLSGPIPKPEHVVDFFSDRDGAVHFGHDRFKYLVEDYLAPDARVAFDLSANFKTYDPKPNYTGLKVLLELIETLAAEGDDLHSAICGADVVCWRGAVTKIAASRNEMGGTGWKFEAVLFEDTVFFNEVDTAAKNERNANETDRDRLMTYWGHKFESYIFADKGKKPNPEEPVSTWETMNTACTLSLSGTQNFKPAKLFYAAEIDGLDSKNNLLEVKTNFERLYVGRFFNSKATKWYLQSKLVGIDSLIVGLRSNDGIVRGLQVIELEDLRQRLRNYFSPRGCMEVLQLIIAKVRALLEANPGKTVVFERKPDNKNVSFHVVDAPTQPVLTESFKTRFGSQKDTVGNKRGSAAVDDAGAKAPKQAKHSDQNP